MKTRKITIKLVAPKTRAHYVLFCDNTPFKAQVVASKNKYQRKAKHHKNETF